MPAGALDERLAHRVVQVFKPATASIEEDTKERKDPLKIFTCSAAVEPAEQKTT